MEVSSRHAHEITSSRIGGANGARMFHTSSDTEGNGHSVAGIGHFVSGNGHSITGNGHSMNDLGSLSYQKPSRMNDYGRASSPTGSVRSTYTTRRHSSRKFSGGFSRSHSLSHRAEMSKELTAQGEREFFALVELMNNISRKSTSLKDVWNKLISEREMYMMEMDKMQEQLEEFTEIIEQKDRDHDHHSHEHEERKHEVSKLRMELNAAQSSASEYRKKLQQRDSELVTVRSELDQYKDIAARLRDEQAETRLTLDDLRSKLTATEGERDSARAEVEKISYDLRTLDQKYGELQSAHRELTNKHDSTKSELASLTTALASLKKERQDWYREKSDMAENLRKANHKSDELSHKLKDVTDKYDSKTRELQKVKDHVTRLGHEKDELHLKVEELKRQLNEVQIKWEDAEDMSGKWKLKSDQSEREMIAIREELKLHEMEKSQLQETIAKNREEIRLLISDKKRVSEDYHHECKKSEEHHRGTLLLQESLRRVETQLKEKTDVVHQLTERVKKLETEKYESTRKSGDLSIENEQNRASITSLKAELVALTGRFNAVSEKLRETEIKYEEVCETIEEFSEGHSEFEFEISNLRNMLREAREQKEKAITARNTADQERDDAIARYDEKCRELERFEEQSAQHMHSQEGSESRRTTIKRYRHISGHSIDGHSIGGGHVHEHGHKHDHDRILTSHNGHTD